MSDLTRTPSNQHAQQQPSPATSGLLQRKCACGNHTVAGGECAACAQKRVGLQRKLTIGASNDPLEQEADRVADAVVNNGGASQPLTTPPAKMFVQRQSADTSRPDDAPQRREQPTTFPVEEQPKQGQAKEDEEKEKLKTGALKAAGEVAGILWQGFSTAPIGMQILAKNEADLRSIIKFFEDFASTWVGKLVLGTAAGAAMTGAFLGASAMRDANATSDPTTGEPAKMPAPKDEKFFALELNWDFVTSPSGIKLKTPLLDLPKVKSL